MGAGRRLEIKVAVPGRVHCPALAPASWPSAPRASQLCARLLLTSAHQGVTPPWGKEGRGDRDPVQSVIPLHTHPGSVVGMLKGKSLSPIKGRNPLNPVSIEAPVRDIFRGRRMCQGSLRPSLGSVIF